MELNLTGRSGHGTPDELASLSAVMINGDEIVVDNGAIHGKSRFERGVDFRSFTAPEQVPNAERIAVIWVTLQRYENGMGYNGLCATEIFVNLETNQGYKSMAALVNQMDRAMKGKVDLACLSAEEKGKFAGFLAELRADLWANTPDEVKAQLS